MSTQEFADKVRKVSAILDSSGFAAEADRLLRLLNDVVPGAASRVACLEEIEGLCGIKSYGDLYVPAIDDSAWLKLLSEVRVLARGLR